MYALETHEWNIIFRRNTSLAYIYRKGNTAFSCKPLKHESLHAAFKLVQRLHCSLTFFLSNLNLPNCMPCLLWPEGLLTRMTWYHALPQLLKRLICITSALKSLLYTFVPPSRFLFFSTELPVSLYLVLPALTSMMNHTCLYYTCMYSLHTSTYISVQIYTSYSPIIFLLCNYTHCISESPKESAPSDHLNIPQACGAPLAYHFSP